MSLKYLLIGSISLLSILVSVILLLSFRQLACEGQAVNDNLPPTPSQQILGERLIGQSFVASRNRLNRLDLFLQTYSRQNTQPVFLSLLELPPDLSDSTQEIEVFRTTFRATTIRDKAWHTFIIPELPTSAGKTYLITLQSPDSVNGDAITVGGIQQDVYPPGSAFVYAPDLSFPNLTPVPGDIMFRTCYEMTLPEKWQVLAEQITRNRPGLWGNFGFYVFSLLIYGLLLIALLWWLIKLGQLGSQKET
jgi:hypothetical protein